MTNRPFQPGSEWPFLKWAGGKADLAEVYLPHFRAPLDRMRRRGGTWHEPFVGGGGLFFRWLPPRASLSDRNPWLVDTWVTVRDDVEALIARLRVLAAAHDAERYYAERERFNRERESMTRLERSSLLLYFNRAGFNGLWRMNSRGEFNVPIGRYERPNIVHEDRLRACSAALRRTEVELAHRPFGDVETLARPGDVVYFDPPYEPLSETARFVAYAPDGFDFDDQRALRDVARRLVERGVTVRLSNSSAPRLVELYRGPPFRVVEVHARRSVNSDASARGPVKEILVLGDP